LAYVPQEPRLSRGSTREVIAEPFTYRANMALRGNLTRVEKMFAQYQLDAKLLNEPVDSLSGGEKQRVVLIAALLLERPILLLDEASSALDPASKAAVAADIASRRDLTVLSISHDTRGFDLEGRIIDMDELRQAKVER
jgi:ABC-type bacteriocin/lantibiotic exporter with double-glycine peptidase domain